MVIEINVFDILSWIVALIMFYSISKIAQFEGKVSWAAYITLAFSSVYGFANAIQTIIEKFS
jgi:hypothetical protein